MTKAISIRQLTKRYDSGHQALKGIDLDVEQGDFFALLGPNGAGKSTTIGILSSLVRKTSGTVHIQGIDIDKNFPAAKALLGLVPQEFNFNSFELVENILITQAGYYGIDAKLARERSDHYLKKLGLWEKRKTPTRNLSGGMKRRLMIARALIHHPKILILDEPTAGVDIELRRSMWDFLQEINAQGTTIILTTHYLEEAEHLCRNIAIIDQGEIIKDTSMRELLRQLQEEAFILDLDSLPAELNLEAYHYRQLDGNSIEVTVKKGQGLNALFELLNQQNIQVLSLRNKASRLEELFVDLVEKEGSDE